jgi:hypothetical protein
MIILNKISHSIVWLMATGAIITGNSACNDDNNNEKKTAVTTETCVDTLQRAMADGSTFFIKVHAGEALVLNGYTNGVEGTFTQLRGADPGWVTGSTRVLARLYHHQNDTAKYNECINLVIDRYLHSDSAHPRLVGVESLGKLGFNKPLPEIVKDAQAGEGGFRAMARWVLANDGSQATEDSLAALLKETDVTRFRGAAYALRFKQSVSDSTYALLQQCAGRLPADDAARVYVVSALFVHTPADKNADVKKDLLQYATHATPGIRYETAEGLSLKGTAAELPVLETLLKDADMDVRVAAANAIIRINKRSQ